MALALKFFKVLGLALRAKALALRVEALALALALRVEALALALRVEALTTSLLNSGISTKKEGVDQVHYTVEPVMSQMRLAQASRHVT